MKDKQTARWGTVGTEAIRSGQVILSHPAIRRLGMLALRFTLGFCLSHAVVFENRAPFGVAWVATAPAGIGGVATLMGSLLGYLTLWGSIDAMKYIAIAVLVYSAGVVFRATSLGRHPLFIPMVTGIIGGFVGLVFLFGDGLSLSTLLLFVTDTILMCSMAFFYRMAKLSGLNEGAFKRNLSVLVLASTFLLSISQLVILNSLHPARMAAGIFVLYCAWQGGTGIGSSTGLTVGIALDMGLGYPFFSMTLGLAGLLSGIFRRLGKLAMVIVYVVGCGIAALWAGTDTLRMSVLLETFVTSVVFMLIPIKPGSREIITDNELSAMDAGQRAQTYAKRRLAGASSAFRELHEGLTGYFDKDRFKNDNDIAMVYDRVADRVCRRCRLRSECWDTRNTETCHALGDASGKLVKKAKADISDFPEHFSSRCIQITGFVHATNEELDKMLQRRQYRSRLMENRRQICRQYEEMSRILDDVAEDVAQGVVFDPAAEQRVERFLDSKRIQASASVYKNVNDRRRVELTGSELSVYAEDREFIRQLSGWAGFPLSWPEERHTPEGQRLIFPEAEVLEAVVGAVSHKKQGQSVSGDCGSWFKTDNGKLFMILADGMGSGRDAAQDSTQACSLMERFLRAGISPEVSLEMLNSALVLKSEVETGLVTVDLLICDLFTGDTVLYKHGASASYIKRGKQVQCVSGRSLPAGARLAIADRTRLTLKPGDTLFLISDGIAGSDDDEWLRQGLVSAEADGPRALSEKLLELAVLHHGKGDDMTVLALAIQS